ncbi:MAG: 2,3,4,5-tetrahydropyridine-2,6-dicarboxylate N-succinyltransferase, partial [Massilia sp.]
MTQQLQNIIDTAWEQRADISPNSASAELRDAVAHVLAGLDDGSLRVAQKDTGTWVVNQWLKKAVLLSFRIRDNEVMDDGVSRYFDKVDTKFADWKAEDFSAAGFRAVPGAVARKGAFIAKNTVLMPSFVNIGAFVDEGT